MGDYTDLGKYLKKLRIDKDEKMQDMATKLNVSTSFLSSVENGKKKMPSTMMANIISLYTPDEKNKNEFIEAAAASCDKVEIPLDSEDVRRKEVALHFAAGISQLTEEQLKEIYKVLEGKKK